MKTQNGHDVLMQLVKNNLKEIIRGRNSDSYSIYVANLTLMKILEAEEENDTLD